MKNALLIFFLVVNAAISTAQNQNASSVKLETTNFVLGSTSVDTLYGRNLIIELPTGSAPQSCRMTIEDITSNATTVKDTIYPFPYTNQSDSGTYSLQRAGNNIVIELDAYSLLNRHRLRFYFIDNQGNQSLYTEMEF